MPLVQFSSACGCSYFTSFVITACADARLLTGRRPTNTAGSFGARISSAHSRHQAYHGSLGTPSKNDPDVVVASTGPMIRMIGTQSSPEPGSTFLGSSVP